MTIARRAVVVKPSSSRFRFLLSEFQLLNWFMCGRYIITQDLAGLEKLVRFIISKGARPQGPRYNLAPRQQAPVLVWETGQLTLKFMCWGLIPSWSKDETIGDKLTNARAYTISEKPSYRKPFEK